MQERSKRQIKFFVTMKEILEKVLTDKAARHAGELESLAIVQNDFSAWAN